MNREGRGGRRGVGGIIGKGRWGRPQERPSAVAANTGRKPIETQACILATPSPRDQGFSIFWNVSIQAISRNAPEAPWHKRGPYP